MVWNGMVSYGMVRCGMLWYGVVWYGMLLFFLLWRSHVPAGKTARHALPGQSAREQSAGTTLAGRALTTTMGWMPPSVWGGGGGRR